MLQPRGAPLSGAVRPGVREGIGELLVQRGGGRTRRRGRSACEAHDRQPAGDVRALQHKTSVAPRGLGWSCLVSVASRRRGGNRKGGRAMPIAITDEHQELAATVWGVLTSHHALAANRALLESDDEPRPSFWREMADLEWLGVHLPEEIGGGGGTLNELVVIARGARPPGRARPVPADGAGVGGHRPVRHAEQQRALLPGLADGRSPRRSGSPGRSRSTEGCSTGTAGSSSAGRPPTCCCCGPVRTSSSCGATPRVSHSAAPRTSTPPAAPPR